MPRGPLGPLDHEIRSTIRELEVAFAAHGADVIVIPALRPLLGGLHAGCFVVSRGPWIAQRALLTALLLGPPPRRASGPVDARIDRERPRLDDGAAALAVRLTCDPRARRALARHALGSRAGLDAERLRHGQISAPSEWSALAEASSFLASATFDVVDGLPGRAEVVFGDDVCWCLQFSAVEHPEDGHADIVIDVYVDERGVQLRAVDGRVEPPVLRLGRIVDGVVRAAPEDPDEACALDDVDRRAEDAAARVAADFAWSIDDDDDVEKVWEPPPEDASNR
jgi:hypothetical protein